MNNYYALTDEQKVVILAAAESSVGLPAAAIEKDLWVTCVLQMLFCLELNANIIFKGGTSLSKIGNLIQRFSEDIDIAIDPSLFGLSGDLTKKQIKKLRKASSLFVSQTLAPALNTMIEKFGLYQFLTVDVEPDGEGDSTYPEPRRIYVRYQSLVSQKYDYLKNNIVLEVGARSLMEPTIQMQIKSLVEQAFPNIQTSIASPQIITSAPAKTFLEKVCLLHELFFVNRHADNANRRSRHLYDLERMMDSDFATNAIHDNVLWNSIQHHRSIYTSVQGIDYTQDFRPNMLLTPPQNVISAWEEDYNQMCSTMIYGDKLPFGKLLERIHVLEKRFHDTV